MRIKSLQTFLLLSNSLFSLQDAPTHTKKSVSDIFRNACTHSHILFFQIHRFFSSCLVFNHWASDHSVLLTYHSFHDFAFFYCFAFPPILLLGFQTGYTATHTVFFLPKVFCVLGRKFVNLDASWKLWTLSLCKTLMPNFKKLGFRPHKIEIFSQEGPPDPWYLVRRKLERL